MLRFTRLPSCAVSQDGQDFLFPGLAQAVHQHELEVQRVLMLLHVQRPLGMHNMARLANEIWDKNADVLSVTASKNWVDLHDPHSRKESLSEFQDSSLWAFVKPEKMGIPVCKGCECKGQQHMHSCQLSCPVASVFGRSDGLHVLPSQVPDDQPSKGEKQMG